MAKYTTQLRSVVESKYPIFDFEYPIFDESYRSVLEKKIIDHYYFREIGFETVGMFKHFLKARMNVIMPYYNDHYLALKVFKTYDPYVNKDITTTETRTNEQNIDGTTGTIGNVKNTGTNKTVSSGDTDQTQTNDLTKNTTNTGSEVFSDTPQGKLSGLDYATNLTDRDNTQTEKDTGTVKNVSNSNNTDTQTVDLAEDTNATVTTDNTIMTTDEYIQTIKGFDGMKYTAEVYMDVKQTIVNLDKQIIGELNDLFMNIY